MFEDTGINTRALSEIAKVNIIMNEVDLKAVTDPDYLKGACSWAITNFTVKLLSHLHALTDLSRKQFSILLQVPFLHLEQLVQNKKSDQEHLKF